MDVNPIVVQVRAALPGSTPLERARLLETVSREVYNHVKFRGPEGSEYGDVDSGERMAVARVVDATVDYLDTLRAIALRDQGWLADVTDGSADEH